MRMRTALAATALGALVLFGGATAAHADVDEQSSIGAVGQGNQGWQAPSGKDQDGAGSGSDGNQEWQEPTFEDQGGAAFGGDRNQDMGEGQGFGDAEGSFQQ